MQIKKRSVLHLIVAITVWATVSGAGTGEPPVKDGGAAFPDDISVLNAKSVPVLKPEEIHGKLSPEIVSYLNYNHYRSLTLDDALSEKVLTRYLSELDNMRVYFRAEDIEAFEPFRRSIDDDLKNGNLLAGYRIFNRYQRRVIERMEFMIQSVERGLDHLDFSTNEVIEVNREKASWPADEAEQDDLWRKRLKNDVLNLKLSGESLADVEKKLLKRYRDNLERVKQRNSEDVFRMYLNAYAQNYDPHTLYFSPRLSENFNIMMRLSLEGIGALLQRSDEYTKVVRLIPAGPADKSGLLKPGDRITGVGQGPDGEIVDVIGWRLDEVVDLIRGPKETVVRLRILPADAVDDTLTRTISITRNTVKLEDQAAQKDLVEWERDGRVYRIGIIEIPTFYIDFEGYYKRKKNYRSTTRDVRRILDELKQEQIDGLIIDLRDNGGGALQEAYQLTGLFIERGPIVQVRDYKGRVRTLNDPDPNIVYDGPLLVLINRISASASEIFSGAIQDYHRGVVVGGQTFGKGTVQTLERLDQGQLKLTNGKFYRISGESTQNLGIIPDIVYPSMYDKDKIGESALPEALPWDAIKSVPYRHFQDKQEDIEVLRKQHEARIVEDPGFVYLRAGIERIEEARAKTHLSLNESERVKEFQASEKSRLDLANLRRKAQALPPFKTIEELKTEEEKEAEAQDDPKDQFDPVIAETKNIMVDYIQLRTKAVAKR